ncbi:hypothetical protein PUNSTDRAFT_137780 [Punctularia strigosozonata HHB-11173 SS5]|uniref:Uncharacterized protein n=1 Tax=Punctularia strigosozonata (strain HHB-11173) TaxID=741275 RepID=R7S579_PUNST|nr:uncharacterized protein PUNSTDRAFT_137780 [Punctularia strigosozonata HHB-11173 SS5]EIN05094.1 hypothetical protein PUNSTDRAFT_137780 [Punctularia strigosozonata HHB-11173 SS5]
MLFTRVAVFIFTVAIAMSTRALPVVEGPLVSLSKKDCENEERREWVPRGNEARGYAPRTCWAP